MAVAIPGWVTGTALGAVFGNILPAFIMSALGIAIYGMFLAIILPPAREDKTILCVVLAAMTLSALFYITPVLKEISSGFVIIITTVLVAGVAAFIKPIHEEKL